MKLLYIKWLDAHSNSGWKTEKELKEFAEGENCVCEEVGWLYKETKKYIVLVGRKLCWTTEENDMQYGLLQKIPKPWIIKRRILK